jgi:glutaredoxin
MVYFFTTKSCGRCKAMLPLVQKYCPDVQVIDVDEQGRYIDEYNLTQVPTLVKDGKKLEGMKPESSIANFLGA